MADEPNDPWSYGVTADDADQQGESDAAGSEADDTARHHTGRWTSPSLGSYDPSAEHESLQDGNGSDDAYFREFGYGEGFGDGRLAAGYDKASATPPGRPVAGGPTISGAASAASTVGAAETGSIPTETRDRDLAPRAAGDRFAAAEAGLDDVDRGSRSGAGVDGAPAPFDDLDESPDGDDDAPADRPDSGADARRNVIEWAVVLVGAVLLALVLRALVVQAFWIPSPSMESTLLVRDRVLVNKVSYRLGDIGRGDVIVFRRTDEEIARNPELPRDVIKRVIALGGETIEIIGDQVFIDDLLLREPYLDDGVTTTDFGPELVPDGHVFVMGDNRELSLDSRFETGPIAEDRVVGRAFFLFWPLSRLGSL